MVSETRVSTEVAHNASTFCHFQVLLADLSHQRCLARKRCSPWMLKSCMVLSTDCQIFHAFPCLHFWRPISTPNLLTRNYLPWFICQRFSWCFLGLPQSYWKPFLWSVVNGSSGWSFFVNHLAQLVPPEVASWQGLLKKWGKLPLYHRPAGMVTYQLTFWWSACQPIKQTPTYCAMISCFPSMLSWWYSPNFCLKIPPTHSLAGSRLWNAPNQCDTGCRNLWVSSTER